MDYPLLNLLFGLGLIFTLVVNIGLRVLLSKVGLPVWLSWLSWAVLFLNILSALYIESLFLRLMTPAFNWQIGFGLFVMGGIGALTVAILYRRIEPGRFANAIVTAQMIAGLFSLIIAYGLYRSLVPIS